MKKLFSPNGWFAQDGLALIRIATGFFMAYHGWELFDDVKMKEYASWDMFKSATFMPYLGKALELIGGILLCIGLLTRVGALLAIGAFAFIAFKLGNGKIWMEDQHPFLFVLLCLVFVFNGPGNWAIDNMLFKKK
jgi:putative oxidoreductase